MKAKSDLNAEAFKVVTDNDEDDEDMHRREELTKEAHYKP